MDQEPICIAYAAQKICEQGLSNALVLPRGAASLPQLFAAGELDAITINFPGRAQEQSLACYLPENLDALTYVPLGMEEAVENFRNRARKSKKRLPQES